MSEGDFPRTWTRERLMDVVEPRRERVMPASCPDLPFVGMENVEAHTTKILGTAPASSVKSSAARFASGDVLYGRLRPYLNKVARPEFDGIASGEFIVFPDQEHLRSSFLQSRLNARDFVNYASRINAGDRPRVDFDQIGEFEIALPPKNEQWRIVSKVDELFSDLDAGVAALERARANLKRYRAAVLKAAVEGRLTEAWRKAHPAAEPAGKLLARILAERRKKWEAAQLAKFAVQGKAPPKDWKDKYAEPAKPDTANLPELPKGWCWATMEQVGEVQLGRQRSPKNVSKDYPTKYLRAANITELGLDLSDVLEMEFKPNEKQNFLLRDGDLILSEASGSPKQVGKPAIWKGELDACCFQNTVIRLRPADVGLSVYLHNVLRAFYIGGVFAKTATGVGINHLSAYKFAKLPLPLAPQTEQAEVILQIEAVFSTIAHSELEVGRACARATRLRQSILKRAFEGKLVPQDPNDEPASVLLARIRAARAKQAAMPKPVGTRGRNTNKKDNKNK